MRDLRVIGQNSEQNANYVDPGENFVRIGTIGATGESPPEGVLNPHHGLRRRNRRDDISVTRADPEAKESPGTSPDRPEAGDAWINLPERICEMSRSKYWMLASVVAGGLAGCAHCDTCDDFPVPCNGPGCSTAMSVMGPGPMMSGPAMAPPMMLPGDQAEAPAMTPTLSPPAVPEVAADAAPETEAPAATDGAAPTLPPPPPGPETP